MSDALAVRREGRGPPVILVHGGAGPELTWEHQTPLAERWSLVVPSRRGYPPSPPAERQDYELDARDLAALLVEEGSAHLIGFSYGAVGATIAAADHPARVRSLILIEPALFSLARDNPTVAELERLARTALSGDRPRDDPIREAFMTVAGLAGSSQAAERARVERIATGLRFPGDAEPDIESIASAGVPCLVVSGEHQPGIEAVCDAVARRLGAPRLRCPGAGHAAQRAPGFNEALERFLKLAERSDRGG